MKNHTFTCRQRVIASALFLILGSPIAGFSQVRPNQVEIPAGKTLRYEIRYGSAKSNTSSNTIDATIAFVIFKSDGAIRRLAVYESEPDSAIFTGTMVVPNTPDSAAKNLQVYTFSPQEAAANDDEMTLKRSIQDGKQKPKPVFFYNNGQQVIVEVFDFQSDVEKAAAIYAREQKLKKDLEKKGLIKPRLTDADLQLADMTEAERGRIRLLQKSIEREQLWLRMETVARQKSMMAIAAYKLLDKKTKTQRSAKSDQEFNAGMAAYQKGDYTTAVKNFSSAIESNPTETARRFYLGVTQYRLESIDEAMTDLRIADIDKNQDLERQYYYGLIYYKLADLQKAFETFDAIKKTNHPTMAPSAAFYSGIVLMSEEKYEKAKAEFEFVLDASQDSALDQKSEEMIERITQIQQYQAMANKHWFVTASLGSTYDSNILLTADNDSSTGSASERGGLRINSAASLSYRYFMNEKNDLATKLSYSNTYSIDDQFASADPTTVNLSVPYNRKLLWRQKGVKLAITPNIETLYMAYNDPDVQEVVLQSEYVTTEALVVMADDWFSSGTVDLRYDDSQIDAEKDDEGDAIKISLKKTEMIFLDTEKKNMLIANVGYVRNQAEGDNKIYERYELGVMYMQPFESIANATWMAGFSYYSQRFPEGNDGQRDKNLALNGMINKVTSERWSWNLTGNYTSNASNQDDSTYSKYSVAAAVAFAWDK
jgi:tetratricopeptide (TPR) repeat protein